MGRFNWRSRVTSLKLAGWLEHEFRWLRSQQLVVEDGLVKFDIPAHDDSARKDIHNSVLRRCLCQISKKDTVVGVIIELLSEISIDPGKC
jgi:hypothetical protein